MGEYSENSFCLKALRKWLQKRNACILEPKASDEVLRFSTRGFDGVIHKDRRGRYLTNSVADKAITCFLRRQPWAGGIGSTASTKHRKERTRFERVELVRFISDRDGGCICAYCGKMLPEDEATLEHVIPISKGGPDIPANIVIACKACNRDAGSLSPKGKMDIIRTYSKMGTFSGG